MTQALHELRARMREITVIDGQVCLRPAPFAVWRALLKRGIGAPPEDVVEELLASAAELTIQLGSAANGFVGQMCSLAAIVLGSAERAAERFNSVGLKVSPDDLS